jgi:hypothetical protein
MNFEELREKLAVVVEHVGDWDDEIFIGAPEIADLARRCRTSRSAVDTVIHRIVQEHGLSRIRAEVDGEPGYMIPRKYFS